MQHVTDLFSNINTRDLLNIGPAHSQVPDAMSICMIQENVKFMTKTKTLRNYAKIIYYLKKPLLQRSNKLPRFTI